MKSILWILNGCGLEGQGITGAPVRFHEISRRFADAGHDQHLLTTPGGKTMQTTLGCRLPMTVVPASLFLRREPCKPFRFWSYLVTSLLWRLEKSRLPETDVIITVSDYFCDIVPAVALKRQRGAKWIAWIHHCETDPKTRPGLRLSNEVTARMQAWSFRQIARHADIALINGTVAGDEIKQRLLALDMPSERMRRMKAGIDFASISKIPEPAEKKTDAVMIGVRPNKGLHDIVPVWKRVNALRPGTTLTLMGGMDGIGNLETEIQKSHLPITLFRPTGGGFLPANEYFKKIKEARILFAPSHEEGWGVVACEAMAAGLPVVAYDLPAYWRIYAGAYEPVTCFDHGQFAEHVVKVLDDAERFADLRRKGIVCSARYDWERIVGEDENILAGIPSAATCQQEYMDTNLFP